MKYIITYVVITTTSIGGKVTQTTVHKADHSSYMQNAYWRYNSLLEYQKRINAEKAFLTQGNYTLKEVTDLKIDSTK